MFPLDHKLLMMLTDEVLYKHQTYVSNVQIILDHRLESKSYDLTLVGLDHSGIQHAYTAEFFGDVYELRKKILSMAKDLRQRIIRFEEDRDLNLTP